MDKVRDGRNNGFDFVQVLKEWFDSLKASKLLVVLTLAWMWRVSEKRNDL